MSGYVKICLVIAGLFATITFAVSIPVNLLGTSLIRALVAFLFFTVTFIGAGWLFHRFSSSQEREEETSNASSRGEHIDLQTPEDPEVFSDIYSLPDNQSEETDSFEPLSAPKLEAEQLSDIIRRQSMKDEN